MNGLHILQRVVSCVVKTWCHDDRIEVKDDPHSSSVIISLPLYCYCYIFFSVTFGFTCLFVLLNVTSSFAQTMMDLMCVILLEQHRITITVCYCYIYCYCSLHCVLHLMLSKCLFVFNLYLTDQNYFSFMYLHCLINLYNDIWHYHSCCCCLFAFILRLHYPFVHHYLLSVLLLLS